MNKEITQNSPRRWLFPVLLITGLPILAVSIYSYFFASGTGPENTMVNKVQLDSIVTETEPMKNKLAPVEALTGKLAARLEASPDDPAGWILLARSYEHLQKPELARKAYSTALQYGSSDTELAKRLGITAGKGE